MADRRKNSEYDPKSRVTFTHNPNSWSLNRSATMHVKSIDDELPKLYVAPPLYRAGSMSRFYNSINPMVSSPNTYKGKVKKLCSLFEKPKEVTAPQSPHSLTKYKSFAPERVPSMFNNPVSFNNAIRLPGTEDRIVVYTTSLRGVRRTFEDCYAVRMIFKGFRLWVDERDISMDSAYKKELQMVLGEKNASLPQVFIRGKHVGGAEVIKSMFETGELAKILRGFPTTDFACRSCGDVRFMPCYNCDGSRKVFDEEEDVPKRCLDCNENGLVRCPDCCL
ncbi:hypothetical protein ACFE04_001164 [Oxalis oulophora]